MTVFRIVWRDLVFCITGGLHWPAPIGGRATGSRGSLAEVAGDFYMIIIMVILMIIIILHHGADDYNHMAMQGALQSGLHDGGY